MLPRAEPHRGRIIAAYAVLLAVLLTATIPIYLATQPAWRPTVIRLAASVVLAVATLHALHVVRIRLDAQGPSAFERALEVRPVEAALDARFLALQDELRFGARSQGYFHHIVWPQLAELATRLRRKPLDEPDGRSFGRGPSLARISHLIDRLEERS
jgi:hypothetical protein